MQYFGTARLQAPQTVPYTGTAAHTTNVIGPLVNRVRVVCTTDAFIGAIDPGAADVTITTGHFWPAGQAEYLTVTSGQKVSAIQSVAGGTMYVSEAG